MRLENLVPPPEICKQIPEGAFADSALVWTQGIDGMFIDFRDARPEDEEGNLPAPTLDELLAAIKSSDRNYPPSVYWEEAPDIYGWRCRVWRRYARSYKNFLVDEGNERPVVAAMKAYLALLPKRRAQAVNGGE